MQKFPVVFAMDRAGLVGEDGPTHHGIFDIAFTRSIPNISIMAPSDEDQLADMLATALTIDGPTAIRYPRSCGLGISLKKEPEVLPVGKGVMLREGHDFLIIAIGSMVSPAVEASRLLATEGIAAYFRWLLQQGESSWWKRESWPEVLEVLFWSCCLKKAWKM